MFEGAYLKYRSKNMEAKNFTKSITLQGVLVMLIPYLDLLHSQLLNIPDGVIGAPGKLAIGALGALLTVVGRLRNGGLKLF